MSDELQLVATAALAGLLTMVLVPLARALAFRTKTLDHPVGYKAHGRSTPYLGGLAVITGTLTIAILYSGALSAYETLVACAVGLCLLGTLDDRVGLPVAPRFAAQALAGGALYSAGIHWDLGFGSGADLAVTLLWVVGVVNAFNLMDNLDGATGAVGAVAAAGVGILAGIEGAQVLAELMLALAGACLAFLVFNLAQPPRIFLGDGGSMPIGFLIAGAVMAIPSGGIGGWALLACAPFAGLAILDTTLVIISRRRRKRPVLRGARDHLTHRLLRRMGSARGVALALAGAQAVLAGLAILLYQAGDEAIAIGAAVYLGLGLAALRILESPHWYSAQMLQQAAERSGAMPDLRNGHSEPMLESAT